MLLKMGVTLITVEFSIWMASKELWGHLVKSIDLHVVPRVGEYIKFNNAQVGDYFAWKITEVTYREKGTIEISTELLDNVNNRMYSFETNEEFYEYYNSYLSNGWKAENELKNNPHFKGNI